MAWHEETSWADQILLLAPVPGQPSCQWEVRIEGALGLGETAGKLRSQGISCVNGGIPLGKKGRWSRCSKKLKS